MRVMGLVWGVMFALAAGAGSPLWAQNDKAQANAYDDGWETGAAGWVAHCQTVFQGGTGKTAGFTLQIGDSITHTNAYSQWVRITGAGQTVEDDALLTWIRSRDQFPISTDNNTASKNGFYLAVADTATTGGLRGMTAAGGLRTDEFMIGDTNGGAAMPQETASQAAAQSIVGALDQYGGNLHVDTVITAFQDAQIAVVMFGTNSANAGRSPTQFNIDLDSIINKLEARNIVVVLSTIPPIFVNPGTTPSLNANVDLINTEIRNLAQIKRLPLIDYYAEILARRPGLTADGTLISGDGVHPTSSQGGYNPNSDPYTPGGNPATHQTGDACLNSGYLLRGWLTVQKLKEVKALVIDGVPAAPTNLLATAGDTTVDLSWTSAGAGLTTNVYMSTTSGSGYTQVISGLTGTTYTVTGLTNGTPYYFVVRSDNGQESADSNEASATPTAGGGGTPSPPSNKSSDDGACGCSSIPVPDGLLLPFAALLGLLLIRYDKVI